MTTTALKVMTEVGPDLFRFKSAKQFASKQFASRPELRPSTQISGGKVLQGATKRTANRLAQALRMAAYSLSHSNPASGAHFRRPFRADPRRTRFRIAY